MESKYQQSNWINVAKFHLQMLMMFEKGKRKIKRNLTPMQIYKLVHTWNKQWEKSAEVDSGLTEDQKVMELEKADKVLDQLFIKL